MKIDSDFIKVINEFLGANILIALKYNSINSIEDFIKLKGGEIKNLKKSSIKNISNSTVLDILNNRNNIIKLTMKIMTLGYLILQNAQYVEV